MFFPRGFFSHAFPGGVFLPTGSSLFLGSAASHFPAAREITISRGNKLCTLQIDDGAKDDDDRKREPTSFVRGDEPLGGTKAKERAQPRLAFHTTRRETNGASDPQSDFPDTR